jgi:hypothetical protein
MRIHAIILAVCLAVTAAVPADDNKLLYADFETPMDQRPVSGRGGWIQMTSYQENNQIPVHFTGMPGAEPAAPALKMTAK